MYGDDAWKMLCWFIYITAVLAVIGIAAIIKWVFL